MSYKYRLVTLNGGLFLQLLEDNFNDLLANVGQTNRKVRRIANIKTK